MVSSANCFSGTNPSSTEDLLMAYASTRDKAIRDQVVKKNQNLVRFLAGRFANRGEPFEDLVQVGNIGLINAIDRYSTVHGTKFSTYATPTIIGEIRRHFRDKVWKLSIPRYMKELCLDVEKVTDSLEQEKFGDVSIEELALRLDASENDTSEAIRLLEISQVASINQTFCKGEGEGISFLDVVGDEDQRLWSLINYDDLKTAINYLKPKERDIIYYRFFKFLSQTETAERLNISQMHVSRLQAGALSKLKDILVFPETRIKEKTPVVLDETKDTPQKPLVVSEKMAKFLYAIWQWSQAEKYWALTKIAKESSIDYMWAARAARRLESLDALTIKRCKHHRAFLLEVTDFIVEGISSMKYVEVAPRLFVERGRVYKLGELKKTIFEEVLVET